MFSLCFIFFILSFHTINGSICPESKLIEPCKCHQYLSLIECGDELTSSTTNNDDDQQLRTIFRRLGTELSSMNVRSIYDQFKLVNTKLVSIGSNIFGDVSFRRINFQRNGKLERIDPDAFRSSFNITTDLVFEDNERLGSNERDVRDLFDGINRFRELRLVRLTDSGIRSIPDYAFNRSQPTLRELLLTDNRIETIGNEPFSKLDGLQLLNMDGNQISHLSQRSMAFPANRHATTGQLKILLRSNRLTIDSFPIGIFAHVRRPVLLDLGLNNLTTIPQNIFQQFFWRHNILSINRNPLKCDCQFKWLYEQRLLYNATNTNSLVRQFQCIDESHEDREHEVNIIHEVNDDDFQHCPSSSSSSSSHDKSDVNSFEVKYGKCIDDQIDPDAENVCLNGSMNIATFNHYYSMIIVLNISIYYFLLKLFVNF